ncbi:conserved Plasmodium protein, unknown function [Plasmodium knowlesi strain H]|uniref:Uncharacterized protein n=3 Tax=Plasmodium knowlesi TaxID=5850 RepID=A0A1A7VGQ6_PLAKH|nr:conserved Plasmodium protein, unknown function [Plasmodium knowlesi strain H]OTN63996.1 Uncharacterized protein PKNOH_S140258300 [Plasmodium knowlesi]CAA9990998.1 conserved Plasmodium protein, unknown function [Plasmodium knowlesi strain H]SBO20739.1 conserved Plasmodium protein, unknown function [Plasmodium knowlesi strain H]SBO21187.1 conserved Plasmodium protein, unknown function [Plasmodium knowlesi strain H]VVS80472.1 conserved Plasmodium protein, unknown function [Plasmodium knowlesi 
MNRASLLLLFLFFFFETLLGQIGEHSAKGMHPRDGVFPRKVFVTVNKPRTVNDTSPRGDGADFVEGAKQNEYHNVVATAEELLHIIAENKHMLLGQENPNERGLKAESEIINANDENVLNLLLSREEKETKRERKYSPPVILVLPQPLTRQELFYYEKYKHLKGGINHTKPLLLRVSYFAKLIEIRSKNKAEAIEELAIAEKMVEKCNSRINVIDEALEEISIGVSTREDKNTKRLRDERTFLNQKRRVLNRKIKKLRLIN